MSLRRTIGLALAGAFLLGTTALAGERDPLQIYVSKDKQSLVVYDGATVIATSNVSTGKAGHTTPSGIFSILQKKKIHFSNLYDDAPMPFMQRITWSGVALHESAHVPKYPASHGCVRMPGKFAKTLYGMTSRGVHVIITDREIAPRQIVDADLFVPRYAPPAELLSDAELRADITPESKSVEVAMADVLPKAGATVVAKFVEEKAPVRVLITRVSDRERVRTVQRMLTQLGYDTGTTDGIYNGRTRKAIKAYQELHGQKSTGTVTADLFRSIHKVLNRKPVSGWLYVRQNFKPVFDTAVEIADPELALGTHFYQAIDVNPTQHTASWFASTLDNEIAPWREQRLGITRYPDPTAPDAAEEAFKRIAIPTDARERIEAMMGDGSSLTITDTGTDEETGEGTDFITTTQEPVSKS